MQTKLHIFLPSVQGSLEPLLALYEHYLAALTNYSVLPYLHIKKTALRRTTRLVLQTLSSEIIKGEALNGLLMWPNKPL